MGRKRPHNEDAYIADDKLGLYVVADGVGGQAKGEVASQESVEQVQLWVQARQATLAGLNDNPGSDERTLEVRTLLETGVKQACYMVFGIAALDPERKGMSTTISALLIAGNTAFVAQVGDSRVYLVRNRKLMQLTEDHTLFNFRLKHGLISAKEAARQSAPGKNVITRAVGHRDYVEVDTHVVRMQPGDRFLLCSDGLHGLVPEPDMEPLANLPSLRDSVRQLTALANDRGGRDNITAVLVAVTP